MYIYKFPAKRSGRFDLGILDLGSTGESVRRVRCVRFLRRHATGQAPVELHTVHTEVSLLVGYVGLVHENEIV